MFTNLSKIPIKLGILLVGFGLLVAGCDSAGPNAEEEQNEDAIAFEAVDANLDDRITYFNGNSSNSVKTAARKSVPGFTLKSRVAPPTGVVSGEEEAASHLALSSSPDSEDRNLYVGYKIKDTPAPASGEGVYGGGIDILDAPAGGKLEQASVSGQGSATTLQSSAVDVQELAVRESGGDLEALYVATAVDPDVTVSRAPQFHSISIGNDDGLPAQDVNNDVVELLNSEDENTSTTGDVTKVAKSLVVDNGNNSYGDVFAVSDENTAHGISVEGDYWTIDEEDMNTIEVTTGRNYRSVTQVNNGDLYALDYSARIFSLDFSSTVDSEVTSSPLGNISNPGPEENARSIARLSSYDFPGVSDELLLVALNDAGFRLYDPTGGEVRYSDTDTYATSVTATDNYVYVASGNGIAVYGVESGLGNTTATEGLEYLGTQPLDELDGGPPASEDVQINHIVVDDNPTNNILYVAKSTDGVYKIRQDADSAWNP